MKVLLGVNQEEHLEVLKIDTLTEINKALSSSLDINNVLNRVMNVLALRLAMSRGMLMLFDYETNVIIAKIFYGTYEKEVEIDDIHKKAFESGLPIAVLNPSNSALFLDSSICYNIKKSSISYLCVPLKIEKKVIGVLSVDRLFDDSIAFIEDLNLLNSITSIISQTIPFHQGLKKEREDLIRENKRLKEELEKEKQFNMDIRFISNSSKRAFIENILEGKLDAIITLMDIKTEGKRRLFSDIISIVEKVLIKLALKRTNNVKYEAAHFLGINRNTLHNKIKGLNI
ncbi:MAG: helix-turn-helix domain-containing protein [Thermodesulfobacteriota bacterium]|nr:helix-turn-helix domain-containing protein [Thermodesulfobacteriota bacterium]